MNDKSGQLKSRIRIPRWSPLLLAAVLWAAPAGLGRAAIVIKEQSPAATKPGSGLVVPAPAEAGAARHEDVLEFLNGDRLHGTFLSLDPKNGVRWQHPAVRQVISISPASLARITLDRPRSTNTYPREQCGIRLTNSDELVGELISLDENMLSLETWYAGKLSIPRKMIGSICPGQAHLSAVYEGPTGLEGWKVSRTGVMRAQGMEAWRFVNGAFVSGGGGSIGRDVKLPGSVNIEFDLAWRGYLQLSVCFFTDNLERYGGNAYMMQFSHGAVYLQRMSRNGNSSSLGQAQAQVLSQQSKARISIRASKEQKTVSLLVDGALIKQWVDRADFPPGTGLLFVQQGQGLLRLSNLKITAWDGKLETELAEEGGNKEDLVQLANNDKISGVLKAIKDGKLTFDTSFATLNVPMERVAQIDLAPVKAGSADLKPTDVRAVFAGQGSITFALERWDDQQIVASSPNFGRTRFLPAAFTQLEFNLDKPRPQGAFDDVEGEGVIVFE